MTAPTIEPINIKYYTVKQSKYETVGKTTNKVHYSWSIKIRKNGIITKYDIRYIYIRIATLAFISGHHLSQ